MSHEGFALLDGEDGKIVGVTFVDMTVEGPNKVAAFGPVSSSSPGAGRKTFEAARQHAEKLGFNVLVRATARPSSALAIDSSWLAVCPLLVCGWLGR